VPLVMAWSCAICGSRMRTLFPQKQPTHAVSTKRIEIAAHCAACGGPHKLEIPETQSLEGVTTSAERDEE
jgi:hypothetical protein